MLKGLDAEAQERLKKELGLSVTLADALDDGKELVIPLLRSDVMDLIYGPFYSESGDLVPSICSLAASGISRIGSEIVAAAILNGGEGKTFNDLNAELAKLSDGSPFSHLHDLIAAGDCVGIAAVIKDHYSKEDIYTLASAGYIIFVGGGEEEINTFTKDHHVYKLASRGDALRALLSAFKEIGEKGSFLVFPDAPDMAAAMVLMGFTVIYQGDGLEENHRHFLSSCGPGFFGGMLKDSMTPPLDNELKPSSSSLQDLIKDSQFGAKAAMEIAIRHLEHAILKHGSKRLEYPNTAYGMPCFTAWLGKDWLTVSDTLSILQKMLVEIPSSVGLEEALKAGEFAMYACETIEALRYLYNPDKDQTDYGFVPDRVLRELGLSFVDDTIPGCMLLMGTPPSPQAAKDVVRECQSKGLLVMVADEMITQLENCSVSMGWDRMTYPLGKYTTIIHAINFALRAALSFGNISPGDRRGLSAYLEKRPKVMVLHFGGLDPVRTALAFAALMHKAVIVCDRPVPSVPDLLDSREDPIQMVQLAIEMRGVAVRSSDIDIPVPYGPAFEGEVIHKEEMYLEMGGGRSHSLELLVSRKEDDVRDGRITLIGNDIDALPCGSAIPLAILVEVYGKNMEPDFEAVLERRIHHFLNFAEGVWHTGQRDMNWLRISKDAFQNGLRLKHLGEILVKRLKNEFGEVVTRVQVTIVTDPKKVDEIYAEARRVYAQRDERIKGLRDESVDVFYTCTLCQSFAPDHVCIISPERLGLCGAINWLDAKASHRISPHGPNQPLDKMESIDIAKGEWEGVNATVRSLSHNKIERLCLYSIMDAPMTSCGCFEAIAAMTPDMQGIAIVDREYQGMTPLGMKFSTLAGSIGGGRQTPGFMGIGRNYITSEKFLAAEGGLKRVVWMPKKLKERLADALAERAAAIGEPDLLDKIADETVCDDAPSLIEWMEQVGHPALRMPSLL